MVVGDVGVGQLIWTTLFLFMLAAFVWVFVVVVRDLKRVLRDGPILPLNVYRHRLWSQGRSKSTESGESILQVLVGERSAPELTGQPKGRPLTWSTDPAPLRMHRRPDSSRTGGS
jgi:hypothetical protein